MSTILLQKRNPDGSIVFVPMSAVVNKHGDYVGGMAGEVSVLSSTNEEIVELLNAAAFAATLDSPIWISTRDMLDGLLHWSTSAAQTGNITAYYSFDGITEVKSETIQALAGGAAEAHSLGFNDFDANADAAGFTRNIKNYPYVRFGLTSGVGSGTTTAMVRVVRSNG